jgi:hypothetical protein
MTATSAIAPARHAPALLGQTVVVIGGSAGIGLETARRARRRKPSPSLSRPGGPRPHDALKGTGADSSSAPALHQLEPLPCIPWPAIRRPLAQEPPEASGE